MANSIWYHKDCSKCFPDNRKFSDTKKYFNNNYLIFNDYHHEITNIVQCNS